MREWPDAPRLRDALEVRAAQVFVDEVPKQRTRELMAEDAAARVVTLPIVRADDPPVARHRPTRPAIALATVAAVVATVATLGVLGLVRSGVEDVDVEAPMSTAPRVEPEPTPPEAATVPATSATPAPVLSRAGHCDVTSVEARPFRLDVGEGAGEIEIGVSGGDLGGLTIFVVTAAEGWEADAERIAFGSRTEPTSVYYVPASFTGPDATAVMNELFDVACNGFGYLVGTADGYDAAAQMACVSVPGRGLQGHAFVDAGPPPSGCRLLHPVVLLDTTSAATIAAWAQHLDCVDPESTVDADGNVITRYAECDTTLVHVDTATVDPWQATIEGRPARDFVVDVMTLPN